MLSIVWMAGNPLLASSFRTWYVFIVIYKKISKINQIYNKKK